MTGTERYRPTDGGDQSESASRTDLWIERDLSSGRFVEDKERKVRGGSFKGVRRER